MSIARCTEQTRPKTVKLLLDDGGDVKVKNNDESISIAYASYYGKNETVKNGAYVIVNERDKNGKTTLMLHTEIVEILNITFQESLQYGHGPERWI